MYRITGGCTALKIISTLSRPAVLPYNSLVVNLYRCRLLVISTTGTGYFNLYRCCSSEGKNKNAMTNVKKGVPSGTFEQVKQNTKTVSYLSIIVVGLGVTGYLFYTVFKELFSSKSPYGVYSSALKRCSQESRVQDVLGEPIKGFGEETRRGRRRHVSHLFYERDGVNYLRMKFYIQGSRRLGTVHLEMKEDDKGQFQYRYLLVQLDDYPPDTIIIEDNRYDKTPPVSDKPFELL